VQLKPKGTVCKILGDSPCKADNARFTTIPLNLYLNNNVKDIVVFLGFQVFNSDHQKCPTVEMNNHLVENSQLKIFSFLINIDI